MQADADEEPPALTGPGDRRDVRPLDVRHHRCREAAGGRILEAWGGCRRRGLIGIRLCP